EPCCLFISRDGTHVFFETQESLVPTDSDTSIDGYERTGGTTNLVSTGPAGNQTLVADFLMVSEDGSRVFFDTAASLVPTDTDGRDDVYERFRGATTLISTGPADNGSDRANFITITPDGSAALFST